MGFQSVPKYTRKYDEKYDKKYRDRSNKEVSDSIQLMVASLAKLNVGHKEWLKKVEAVDLPKVVSGYDDGVYYQTFIGSVTDEKSHYSHYIYTRRVRDGVTDKVEIQKVPKKEGGLLWVKTLRNAELPLLLNEELARSIRESIMKRLKGEDHEIPILQELHDEYAITDRKKRRIGYTYREYKGLMEAIFERSLPIDLRHIDDIYSVAAHAAVLGIDLRYIDDMTVTTMAIDKFKYTFIGKTLVYPKSIYKIKAVPAPRK